MGIDELCVVEALQTEEGIHLVVVLDVEEVLDGTSLGVAVALGNLITLEPVATSLLGEEEHRLVHGGGIDVLGEVLVAGACSLGAYASTSLLTEV